MARFITFNFNVITKIYLYKYKKKLKVEKVFYLVHLTGTVQQKAKSIAWTSCRASWKSIIPRYLFRP